VKLLARAFVPSLSIVTCIASMTPAASAQVGSTLRVINVPVPEPGCCGIGVAVGCNGDLFYTNTGEAVLRRIDAFGNLLGSVPLTDAAGGGPISFGAIAWDANRQMLWAGTDSAGAPIKAYLIDPATGISTFQFGAQTNGGIGFTDGISYDPSDDSIWWSDDIATSVDHQDAATGAPKPGSPLVPTDAIGNPIIDISGSLRGVGDVLYLGHNGHGEIIKVKASDGTFLSVFASPGGRDEDLECDSINFFPKTAIWSKDAYNNQITAIEVETDTCACAGQQVSSFCFGDGVSVPCPCANNGAAGNGCANSDHPGGANLASSGNPSLANDTLVLTATDIHKSSLQLLVQGDTEIPPLNYGDGLRCINGNLRRLFKVKGNNGTTASFPSVLSIPPTPATISGQSAALGDVLSAGSVRGYQVYYRDPDGVFCPPNTFNITNAVRVTWGL
jgi:hypothetical protein